MQACDSIFLTCVGRVAGHNAAVAGKEDYIAYDKIPFFWTMQFGKSLRFVGFLGTGYDDLFIRGDLKAYTFEAFYHCISP